MLELSSEVKVTILHPHGPSATLLLGRQKWQGKHSVELFEWKPYKPA